MKINLYNTLTKKIEEFKPLKADYVRIYDCGPTVYWYAHIGNMWRNLISDFLRRMLEYNGLKVKQVMNITDVGHLTEDDLLAADTGEDKMEVAAKREKKTPQQIADFYTRAFMKDRQRLNMRPPEVMPKATEHIKEMIDIVKTLEKKGYAYWAGDKYFVYDINKFKKYGQLSGKKIDELRVGARLEPIKEKRHPFDFALWIKDPQHLMHWDSPWGTGYPGWHIECSAMSMKYLGPTLDIHSGGEDNIFPHHENEIAQSEAATGKKFVRYWLHVRFNLINGAKMSKSKGNVYTIQDLVDKGFDPLAFRYLCLTAHYRSPLNFTWDSLKAAAKALENLRGVVTELRRDRKESSALSQEKLAKTDQYRDKFLAAINDDLKMPVAMAIVWEIVKSNVPAYDKLDLLLDFDQVLGLRLAAQTKVRAEAPKAVKQLAAKRKKFRKANQFKEADRVRQQIKKLGWQVEDAKSGSKLKPV